MSFLGIYLANGAHPFRPSMGGKPPREDSASHSFRSCMGGSPIPWRVLLNSINPLNPLNLLNLLDLLNLQNLLNPLHASVEFTESAAFATAAAIHCVSSMKFKLISGPYPHSPSLRVSQPRDLLPKNPSSTVLLQPPFLQRMILNVLSKSVDR